MSPIASNIVTILALSSTALAFPKAHHHHRWGSWGSGYGTGHGTGTGRGFPHPTGRVPFPAHNHTEGNGAGSSAQATSLPVLTVTVLPVAASSASLSSNAGDNNVAAASIGSCISTSTSTTTTIQYVTVTASLSSGSSSVAALSVSNTTSTVPTLTGSVQAGEFFGRPSQYGGGFGGWGQYSASSSAVVSTPVASESVESSSAESTPAASVSVESSSAESTPAASASVESSSSATSWAAASTTVASETVGSSASSVASSAWASSTSSSSSGSSGSKIGLSYNTASLLSVFEGTSASWAYNWGASPDGTIPSDLEYVPMLWGLKSVSGWSEAAASAISSGSKHVLSFNEPDLSSQSDMDPATAAQNHIQYLNPLADQAQIGSPAITNGAGTDPLMGIDWLNSFFDSCASNCKVDFVAFHWYDSASNIDGFKSHVQDVINAAAQNGVSKVWLTEFGTTSGSDSDIANFITEATSFLDSTSAVERYAYFMVGTAAGQLLSSSGALNTLGDAYVGS